MQNKDTLLESTPMDISMSADEATDYLWSVTVADEATDYLWFVTVAESEKECTTLVRFNFEDVYIF